MAKPAVKQIPTKTLVYSAMVGRFETAEHIRTFNTATKPRTGERGFKDLLISTSSRSLSNAPEQSVLSPKRQNRFSRLIK